MSLKPFALPLGGNPDAWEYLPATAIEGLEIGTALVLANGKLTKATGSTKPTYISMYGKAPQDGEIIPVIRVQAHTRYMTQFSVAAASVKVGDKLTLDASGTMATATTADGVLEVVELRGTDIGDDVIVRIP